MANVKFYYQSVEGATITINTMTSNTGYPLNNLNDRNKDLYWKEATGNTSGYIQIDLTAARAVDYIILGNHNYTDTGKGIKLQYASDAAFTADVDYAIGSAGAYHDYTAGDVTNWLEIITEVSRRYWRLYLEAMGAATYQQIGTIFMGEVLTHPVNWNFETGKRGYEYGVQERVTVGGTKRTQKDHDLRRTWEYEFDWISETHYGYITSFLDEVYGNYYPFFFADEDGTLFYGRLATPGLKFDHHTYQAYGVPMRIEQEI